MPHQPAISSCPMCGGADLSVLAHYSTDQAAQAFVQRRLDRDRHAALVRKLSSLWRDTRCTLCECNSCGFVYTKPFVSGDEEFYRLAFCDVSYPRRKWEFERTLRALGGLDMAESTLLEVGAGNGGFLKQLLEHGWSANNLHACEFSESGRLAIEELRVTCIAADWRSIDRGATYDVVCMFQVLEHLDDYQGMFKVLNRIVRPRGHLFVATPNREWIASNEKRKLLLDMPPNHISRWSPAAFETFAGRFGWHLEECELEPGSRVQSAARALTDRFVRLVNDESLWAGQTALLASRTGNRNVGRLIKAGAALASPACLYAALRAALATATPQNIWAHLRHPGPAATASRSAQFEGRSAGPRQGEL